MFTKHLVVNSITGKKKKKSPVLRFKMDTF